MAERRKLTKARSSFNKPRFYVISLQHITRKIFQTLLSVLLGFSRDVGFHLRLTLCTCMSSIPPSNPLLISPPFLCIDPFLPSPTPLSANNQLATPLQQQQQQRQQHQPSIYRESSSLPSFPDRSREREKGKEKREKGDDDDNPFPPSPFKRCQEIRDEFIQEIISSIT